jgi:hypothetical protein
MTSLKKAKQSILWLSRVENVGVGLRALFEEIDALSYERDLGSDPAWHTELVRCGVSVHEAIQRLEAVFKADGWSSSEDPDVLAEPITARLANSNLNG